MGPFRKKKKVEIVEKKVEKIPEFDRFETEVYKEIPDELTRKLVEPFIKSPSSIQKINIEEKLEKAKNYENRGQIANALHSLRLAAIAGFYKQSKDNPNTWKVYKDFLERHKDLPLIANYGYFGDIEAYDGIRKNENLEKILIGVYRRMLGLSAEIKKEKPMD